MFRRLSWIVVRRLLLAVLSFHAAGSFAQNIAETPALAKPIVGALSGNLEVDEIIEVSVEGLEQWTHTPGNTPWRLVPFVNERPLPGLYPISVNLKTGKLQFHLFITAANRSAWHNLLSPPTFTRRVHFSVGLETQDSFNTVLDLSNPAKLIVVEVEWAIAALIVGISFVFCFFWLSRNSKILMERVMFHDGRSDLRLSLAKVQLAIWFFVIFSAFILIWLATGNYDTINGSIVGVLGISAGTALGDSYIRASRNARSQTGPANGQNPSYAKNLGLVHQSDSEVQEQGEKLPLKRFFIELISDDEGYSIYRFQMVAWTIVLIAIFLSSVYYNLIMPEFKPDLLYLLGLSSGTYVAHRVPETNRESSEGLLEGGKKTQRGD